MIESFLGAIEQDVVSEEVTNFMMRAKLSLTYSRALEPLLSDRVRKERFNDFTLTALTKDNSKLSIRYRRGKKAEYMRIRRTLGKSVQKVRLEKTLRYEPGVEYPTGYSGKVGYTEFSPNLGVSLSGLLASDYVKMFLGWVDESLKDKNTSIVVSQSRPSRLLLQLDRQRLNLAHRFQRVLSRRSPGF